MSDANIRTVQQIYEAFGRGDVPGIMTHISDDLRSFGVVSDQELVPWHIHVTAKDDVPKFFEALASSSDFSRFEPRDFAAAGDHVYCTISFDATFKRNGQKVTHDRAVHRFTFKDGKVVEWFGTEDTAKVGDSFGAPVPKRAGAKAARPAKRGTTTKRGAAAKQPAAAKRKPAKKTTVKAKSSSRGRGRKR